MPFQSEKQRRYLWANEPEIARDWTDKYGGRVKRANGGIGNFFQKHAPATMNLMQNIPVNKWINQPELIDLETRYGLGSAGLPSIARHTAGMSNLSDTFSSALGGKFQTTPDRVSQFLGDVGAFGLGALNEIPGVYRSITGDTPISETWEDLKANALGTFGTPYGVPSEQIWKDVYADKYADRFYDDEKGTIIPNQRVRKTSMLPFSIPPMLMKWMKAKTQGEGIGMIREKIQARNLAKKKAAMRQQVADAEQQRLQARVTAQANRGAAERVARGEARDYGHTQTRSSSGWRSDPFAKGGLAWPR